MKIAHCITGLTADGAQRMLLRLATQLQERGFENHVISLSRPERFAAAFEDRGIRVHSVGMVGSWRDTFALERCRRLIRDISPGALQGWMYHSNIVLSLLRAALSERLPLLWNIRRGMDDFSERKFRTKCVIRASSLLSSKVDRVIFCTPESRAQHEAFGFCRDNGLVLGNGFDTNLFIPSAELRRRGRERLCIEDDEIVIGNVGRDDFAKGRDYLLEAFSEVLRSNPRARLVMVGRGMERSNQRLASESSSRGFGERVSLLGECSSLQEIYPIFDVLCSSSISEGFPNVVAEAMSCCISCVATDTGSTATIIGSTGVVVPARSSTELARGLNEACAESAAVRGARGVAARARIQQLYSLSCVVDEYARIYSGVVV
jgi:glycosyltransferase involved in cell wall biosynthesis